MCCQDSTLKLLVILLYVICPIICFEALSCWRWALFCRKMQKHSKECPPLWQTCKVFCPWVLFHETAVHPYYSPPVVDTPSDCNITATYSQSSGMLLSINSTWDTVSVSHIIPYSGKFLLGGNFCNFCRQVCFHENKNCENNNLRWRLMTSLCAYIDMN